MIIALDQVMLISMNALLQRYGGTSQGDFYITCNTIVQSFMLVVTMPLGGISGGTQSILGYNFGAGKPKRVLLAQRYIFCAVRRVHGGDVCAGAHGRAVFYHAVQPRPGGCGNHPLGNLRRDACNCPARLQYGLVDGFTGMGQVQYAMPLSFWRKTVYFVSLFLLPALLGVRAIFWAEPICDVLGVLVSITVYLRCIGRLLHKRPARA